MFDYKAPLRATYILKSITSTLILIIIFSFICLRVENIFDSGGISPAMKKMEHYSVQRITGDGRCLFRALVWLVPLFGGICIKSNTAYKPTNW